MEAKTNLQLFSTIYNIDQYYHYENRPVCTKTSYTRDKQPDKTQTSASKAGQFSNNSLYFKNTTKTLNKKNWKDKNHYYCQV